ncbi:putative membrane protein [Methanocella conradii HZ254]|uniref:Membrane protein n=1 Tax=Methanocella conradii (strain DSM 24694 / JCM 17849 / CGMCC 1.5162 / HZ254) TaxID=1041930 RepID=H8IAK5_METCZ|nr:EMC3/TMCO1 family protein [Methanocella conradii]AFD00102.1 putative membrane protein [Methanocella conradii HZ254]MDI6896081.1 EMC3/TMCO1 family protein [Methanocella conradii]
MSDNTAEKKGGGTKARKKGGPIDTIQNIILVLGFGLLLGSILLPPAFRDTMSAIVNIIVSPINSTMPFYIAVLIIVIIVTVFSTIIQKYTMDWELSRRVMLKNRAFQKEYREAQLSGDKKRLKKLEEERLSMMEEQAEMSKQQLKPMGFIVFVSIPLFWWAYWWLMQPAQAGMTMVFPLIGTVRLVDGFLLFPYWVWWSLLCSLAVSSVVRKALNTGVVTS